MNLLDGPSLHTKVSVTSATVVEVKVGSSRLEERKAVTIQSDQRIYLYWGDGVAVPSAATVASNGIVIFKDQIVTLEAGHRQDLYIRAVSTTANVSIVERS